MIATLSIISSKQMGNLLVDAVVAMGDGDPRQAKVEKRLRSLVKMVDLLLNGAELSEEASTRDISRVKS